MKNNDTLHRFANNKKILFFTPHLIYINTLINRYLINREILFFENIVILLLIFLLITLLLQLILKKITKNNQYVFYISTFICLIYFLQCKLSTLSIFLICGAVAFLVIAFPLKKHLDTFIGIGLFILIIYFIISATPNIYSIILNGITTKKYNETYGVSIEKNTETPNIYWIHTDAMMNFDSIQKYFYYNNIEFRKYLNNEGFQINETATLISGHKTQNALAALFNPNYYDRFLKEYLYELEEVYLGNDDKVSFNVSTKELAGKRIDSELLKSLKEKDYTTIAISKFNNYSTLDTDFFYDFYNNVEKHWHFTDTQLLRKISKESINKIETSYLLNQLKEGLSHTIFNSFASQLVPYKYELLDYNNLDISEYPLIDKTNYWQIKAIIKALEDSQQIKSNKFTFIDYDLNHTELSFDISGNTLQPGNYMNINYYLGNYVYSYRLLMEMINYIKANDQDAIIIIQADHGLHTFEDQYLQEEFNINIEGVREIRNSVMNAIYIPEKYKNGEEKYLNNPLNISRYIVNNYVGKNYEYLEYN